MKKAVGVDTNEIWSTLMNQYNLLCLNDEPTYNEANDVVFIMIPKERLYWRQLNKIVKPIKKHSKKG